MISVHRLNGKEYFLNAELIQSVESIPDTTIVLTNGERFIVKESIPEVCERIVNYRHMILHGFHGVGGQNEK